MFVAHQPKRGLNECHPKPEASHPLLGTGARCGMRVRQSLDAVSLRAVVVLTK